MRAIGVVTMTAGLLWPSSTAIAQDEPDRGAALFERFRCDLCHAVSSAGVSAEIDSPSMAGPDLAGLGDQREADWIRAYLALEADLNGMRHRLPFAGSAEDLSALVDWLMQQRNDE